MIRDTSFAAYHELDESNKLPDRRKSVLVALIQAGRPLTNKEIATRLKWPINCVTGRTRELVKSGLVIDAGKIKDPDTGKKAHQWLAVNLGNHQLNLF